MVSEIFESLFWVGPGFIPKSHLVERLSDNNGKVGRDVRETKNGSSRIKSKATIFMRHLLRLRNKKGK
jgi:hypothetical protein